MRLLLPAFLLVFLSACSSIKISHDFDRNVDFSQYKTYALTQESAQMAVDDLNRNRIIRAVETQMAAQGFTKSDQPDVLVDLYVKKMERKEARAVTNNMGMAGPGMWMGPGMGPGMMGPWGWGHMGGFSTTQIQYHKYVDGTLFVSMIDSNQKAMVWQGRATKTLNPKARADQRESSINSGVSRIFSRYPPKK